MEQPNDEIELQEEETEEVASAANCKCTHGVYIAKGDSTARYCGGCNPENNKIIGITRRTRLGGIYEREMDAMEYMEQPVSTRLNASVDYL